MSYITGVSTSAPNSAVRDLLGGASSVASMFPLDCIEKGYKESIYDKLPETISVFGKEIEVRCKICVCPEPDTGIIGTARGYLGGLGR